MFPQQDLVDLEIVVALLEGDAEDILAVPGPQVHNRIDLYNVVAALFLGFRISSASGV